jgi:AcrR family transcriptional regulator
MSPKSKVDPRAERSCEWMRGALLALMKEKDYQKITVSEITDRAGLSRPTFYLHYKSKDEVLIENVMITFEEIMSEFSENIRKANVDRPGALAMTRLFTKIRQNADVLHILFEIGAEKLLHRHLFDGYLIYLKDLDHRYKVETLPEVRQISAHYLAGSTLGMIFPWLHGDIAFTPEQMGDYMSQVVISYLRFAIRDHNLDGIFKIT